ncbi:MAG: transglutaminase-like domain-containing protein, partial [Myxococcota bacterium]
MKARAGYVSKALHALVLGFAAAVFTFPLATLGTAGWAALGAGFAALVRWPASMRRLRTAAQFAVGAGFLALGLLLHSVFTGSLAASFGPEGALRWGDAALFALGFFGASTVSRALREDRRAYAAFEVVFVAYAFGQLVVAHRQGAINRPFEIADRVIEAGGDPTLIFFVVGACATAAIVAVLLRDSGPRVLLHLSALSLLLLLFFTFSSALEVPSPPPGGAGLGLRPDESEGDPDEESQSSEGGGSGENHDSDLEFRDNIESENDQVPVAVVLFHDDYSAPTGTYYFRQGAFSQFNGDRLVAAAEAGYDLDIARDFPLRSYDLAGAPPVNQNRITVQSTVALLAEHTRPFGLEAPITLQPATNPDPSRFRRTYSVTSAVMVADFVSMVGSGSFDPRWTEAQRAHYLEAPDDARYVELVQRILRESLPEHLMNDPVAKVAAITSWLGREGTYSLRSNHSGADDPTAHFLFGDLTGYCVHFAHAGAYLLRTAGVPARVATGYAVSEATRRGGSALLISGDTSHAWPEVYLEGFGWVVADISPQTVISPPPPPADADLQRLLGELARGLRPIPPEPDAPLPAAIATGRRWLRMFGVGSAVLALLLLLLANV